MLDIAELLSPTPSPLWKLVKQAGVNEVVSLLDGGEQQWRWPKDGTQYFTKLTYEAPPLGERPWELPALSWMQSQYRDYGLEVAVLEDTAPMDEARLGLAGRDEQIEWFCTQLRAMGRLGIKTLCYNWVTITSWARTSADVVLRGGALSTGYDDEVMRQAEPLIEPGSITHEQLWDAYEYFMAAVVPVAEEAGVRLSLHPDDPPIPFVRGVPRIMNTPEAFERVLNTVPSEYSGITMCQGNFSLMTDDLPNLIRQLGRDGRIFFAHFRDVVGTPDKFVEVFHDEGPTDMLECMRAYEEIGFDGVLRPDHVPALEGESNDTFGYSFLGRLYAIGYMTGLRESVYKSSLN
ncbi:MAG TPA: mannonate dehydratase [Acidimicrobiales bacterium]|jgi:mannonate dehydratase